MARRNQAVGKARAAKVPAKQVPDLEAENAALRHELARALEREAATGDVLKIISRSTFDLNAVLDTVAEMAGRLCDAECAYILRRDGDVYRIASAVVFSPQLEAGSRRFRAYLDQHPLVPGRGSITGRVALEGRAVHVADVASDPEYALREATTLGKLRTQLGVPLLREGSPIGVIVLGRQRVEPFTEKQIGLVNTFADQAVIAIENTRLLTEQHEAIEQQTATTEVLQVINSSPGDLAPVFQAILEQAHRLCGVTHGSLQLFDGNKFRAVAVHGLSEAFAHRLQRAYIPGPNHPGRQLIEGARFAQIADCAELADPIGRAAFELSSIRTTLVIPLRKDGALLGQIAAARREVKLFTEKEIALLEGFAAQAVIAMENARLITETREALEQQTATAEVLQVINSSPGNPAPVFDAMLEKAMRLCDADFGVLRTYDGEKFQISALRGVPPAFAEYALRDQRASGINNNTYGMLLRGDPVVHVIDAADTESYRSGDPVRRAIVDLGGARTMLGVPLRRDAVMLGAFVIYRQEVRPFSDKQIALLQSFAAQAVIAMENARLITETREALEQQTATAEVLQVINSSPGDLTPVFDAILEKAHSLCGVEHGSLHLYDGEKFRAVAIHGLPGAFAARLRHGFIPSPNMPSRRLIEGARFAQVRNWSEIDDPVAREAHAAGIGTTLAIPLRKDAALLGAIVAARREVRSFTEKEITLLEGFAAQAVIATENARLITETREALERQTATAEVLQVINSSPGDLVPVFEAMLDKALALCGAAFGCLWTYDGERMHAAALRGVPPAMAEFLTRAPHPIGQANAHARLLGGEPVVHLTDVADDEAYRSGDPIRRVLVEVGGGRTMLAVPLRKDTTFLGDFVIYRQEVRPFSDKQIALLQSFAAQAVIAMENARLLGELRQRTADLARSVDELTATGDVLKIISSSSVDLGRVLDTLVETVARLCRADQTVMFRLREDVYQVVAAHGLSAKAKQFLQTHPVPRDRGTISGRVELERRAVHIPDALQDPEYTFREGQKIIGFRTMLGIPLLRDAALIGIFSINRTHVEPFTVKEIELATSFADQAVIAIENARLFDEVRARSNDLSESLQQQTAIGDVLKVISRSTFDLQPVLDTLVEAAARICRAESGFIFRLQDGLCRMVAGFGVPAEYRDFQARNPIPPGRGTLAGRTLLDRRAVHIEDAAVDPEYTRFEAVEIGRQRTMLGVPLARGDALIGVITLARSQVERFTEKQIQLVTTFADQAVIAIENARLFEELRERQAELRVTFDNMGDGVAMFDAESRLTAWNRNFQQIVDLPDEVLRGRPTYADYFRFLAERGEFGTEIEAELSRRIHDTDRELRLERTRPDGRVIEVRRNPVPGGGFVLIYSDVTERKRAEEAIHEARDAAETALRELQAAQASLLHTQKMAALGQLTAGIAHEIKNPLNFVNNFAALSIDLVDELKQAAAPAIGALGSDQRAEIDETMAMLTGNLERIAEHGRRADGIVRSMLQHSRGGSGDWQAVDLNALIEEALNLAYHGARAQDPSFNIVMECDLDRNLAPIEVVPQDVTRVFLNLIGNGFYAANKRGRAGDGIFRPTLKITTRDCGEAVEIGVRDNGIGIPPEHREKLFQPFFTTKPTGEGTGLGLSISYDIVTQQHGGTITVDSEIGGFTEFKVRLPRRHHPAAGRAA